MKKVTSLRMAVKHRWMFVAVLLCGIFVKNSSSGTEDCRQRNVLFVSAIDVEDRFPTEVVILTDDNQRTLKLCFHVRPGKNTACCNDTAFSCNVYREDSLILNEDILSEQDVVLMISPNQDFDCMPSQLYIGSSDFLYKIHTCLNKGNKNFRFNKTNLGEKCPKYDKYACTGLAETDYNIKLVNGEMNCVPCKAQGEKPEVSIVLPPPDINNDTGISPENATNIMNNISSLLEKMGNASTAAITMGPIKGAIIKLSLQDQTDVTFGIETSGDMNILADNNGSRTGYSRSVIIPAEARAMAAKRNGSFAAVLIFPGMRQDDPKSFFLNNEVVGIEMGTEISNLSHTIDLHYRNMDKNGSIASCRSWSGKGNKANWITNGCRTKETTNSTICQCTHLTFFAILMSPPPGNISTSDVTSLTYITSIGCGLSMFFLIVGLFMFCLIRKGKASQATQILMNLFVAMFTLNLSFLVNESIAGLENFGACVTVAAVMHYTLLATFSWFFIEALHLYFSLWKLPSGIKHYMTKMCVTGWVTPAVVVIALLAAKQYGYVGINTDDGNSKKMCWIPDTMVHQGVNVGYYAVVFLFTFSIFIMTVRQIVLLKPTAGKDQGKSNLKTNVFSIVGLFLLLGITWAFAFFSFGPLLIVSYYVFTILNSFQGFFLFIYYYKSSKVVGEDKSTTDNSSNSTTTSNTTVINPYQ